MAREGGVSIPLLPAPTREQNELRRLVLEALFDDMDRSLREMGVGDMGVGKRIKKMAQSVFGRLEAYREAWSDDGKLREALKRNVYRGAEVAPEAMEKLLRYVRGYPGSAEAIL